MPVLIAALVVTALLCLIDLLLTFGVIRRLREHTALLSEAHGEDIPVIGLPSGQAAEPFTATTTDGALVSGPAGLHMVAFFSPRCSVCPKRVPAFTGYLRANQVRREDVLVVVGESAEPVPYLDQLTAVARVCTESEGGPLGKAFGVAGYPAFCLLDADGAVLTSGFDPAELPAPVPA